MPNPPSKTNHNQAKFRDAQVTIIWGRNGTGKSTLVEAIINKTARRRLVVTFNGMPKIWRSYPIMDIKNAALMDSFEGTYQVHFIREEKETFRWLRQNYRNGTLVFDDLRNYIPATINIQADDMQHLKGLLIDFRHRMLDLYFVAHSPTDVPPGLWPYASNLFLGATDVKVSPAQIKLYSAQTIIEVQERINDAFIQARDKNDGSHYGLFELIRT